MKFLRQIGLLLVLYAVVFAGRANGQVGPLRSPSVLPPAPTHLQPYRAATQTAPAPAYATPGYPIPGHTAPQYAATYVTPSSATPRYAQPQYVPPQYPLTGYSVPGYSALGYSVPGNAAASYPASTSNGYAVPPYNQPAPSARSGYGAFPGQMGYPAVPNNALQAAWPYSQVSAEGQSSVMLNHANVYGAPPVPAPQTATPSQADYWTMGSAVAGSAMLPTAGPCVQCGHVRCTCRRNWFASLSGLYMTRGRADHYTFSFGTGNEADQRTNTRDAAMNWSSGFDVRFGHYLNCGQNAIEVVYWGLFPGQEYTQTTSADVLGNLNGILNWNNLDYNGAPASNIVNVAPGADGVHALWRNFEFHNVEVNLWRFCGNCAASTCSNCGGGYGKSCGGAVCNRSRWRYNMLAGVRYFRFHEDLLFGADGDQFVMNYGDDEIFYNIDIDNDLLGFQLGCETEYCVGRRWTLDGGIKLGIYNNHISHISEIGGNLGTATINGGGPNSGRDFYVNNSKNDVSFLGEANLGFQYLIHPNWTARFGYRAVAVTGVALPSEQIYPDLRGINDVELIGSNSSLLLHGGYAGVEYNW